jgi:cell wall-associated NlpC family hydrolase
MEQGVSASRLAIVEAARSCLGTPWRHQGRRPGRALDCGGLVLCAVRTAGFALADHAGYGREPQSSVMGQALSERFEIIIPSRLRPADILWLRFDLEPQHLAIYTERGTIIHALQKLGTVEHGFRPPWPGRVQGYYRVLGIDAV